MPENRETATPPKSILGGGAVFAQRREDIFKRLKTSTDACKANYQGRKELATEKDDVIAELCEALDETFSYGLRQQQANFVVTAASLFQNMQEIMTGNAGMTNFNAANSDSTFWDFCSIHLTPHERQRFDDLKNVWTKFGRGRAFVRASLNENSLQRYLLTWLSDRGTLSRYYTPWSLLLDEEAGKQIPQMIGSLDKVLFALTVDAIELNAAIRSAQPALPKEEPIIYAPTPIPVANVKNKRRTNAVERPIASASSTEDLLKNISLNNVVNTESSNISVEIAGTTETAADVLQTVDNTPFDPIEPELEFLKQPLPDVYLARPTASTSATASSATAAVTASEQDDDDKSDTSSLYSKSSSTNGSANSAALEEKLREMTERYALLETRVAQLSLENRQLVRRLTRHFNETGIDPTSSFATNFLITIPTVKLLNKGRAGSSYYAYEVHITMRHRLEHWSVLRRYREFDKLHKTLLRTHPSVSAVEFPPKKHFGNMKLVFVEERRQQLQIYLLNLVETLPQVEACKTKVELQKVFPFLRER